MSQNQSEIESSHSQLKKQPPTPTLILTPTLNADPILPRQPQHQPQPINNNGFTSRPTLFQLIPIVYACLMLAQIVVLGYVVQGIVLRVLLWVGYGTISVVLVIFWYKATSIDPTDTIQQLHKTSITNQQPFPSENYKYFCHSCQTCVSKQSFHCRRCNRCVDLFDHHCKWLNNCIGAKNYLEFLGLIGIVWVVLGVHFGVNCAFVGSGAGTGIGSGAGGRGWVFWVAVVMAVGDFGVFVVNSILVVMHAYLLINKKTTLKLIFQRRKDNKIFPSELQSDNTSKQKQIYNTEELTLPKEVKIFRNNLPLTKNTEKIAMNVNRGFSFRARCKSFKIKVNRMEGQK